jgi:transcriptional regulator
MNEPSSSRSGLRGTLELLILKAVALEPLHGVGISRRIAQLTQDEVAVSFGSLFPALHRLEGRGWLRAEWKESEHRRRAKYYALTAAGRKELAREERAWRRIVAVVVKALESH